MLNVLLPVGYDAIHQDLSRDLRAVEIKDICPGWSLENRSTFVLSSQLRSESPLSGILWLFSDMIKCDIFHKLWWSYREKLTDANVPQQQFVDEVWICTMDECCQLMITCYDGSALVADVEKLFATFDKREIEAHLKALHEGLKKAQPCNQALRLSSKSIWISHVAKQVLSYRFFKQCEGTANNLLSLKQRLHLDGCFDFLESIVKKV